VNIETVRVIVKIARIGDALANGASALKLDSSAARVAPESPVSLPDCRACTAKGHAPHREATYG